RNRIAAGHREIRRSHQIGGQHHLLAAVLSAKPDRCADEREDLVLAAVEAHPVTRAQHRPRRPARHAATRAITVAGCRGTDRSAVSSCRHNRWYSTGSTATGSPAALAPSISGTGAAN